MVEVLPSPFATLQEFKDRWPDMPTGADAHASVLLEDASQFILDTVPTAALAAEATRRRIVCAVVRRAMPDPSTNGMESVQETTGPFSMTLKPVNPAGDFYLTKQEKSALGAGVQKAFGVQIAGPISGVHLPWCDLNFGGTTCSCGVDIAGEPIYEAG